MHRATHLLILGAISICVCTAALLLLRGNGPPASLNDAALALKQPGGPNPAEWDRLLYEAERGNASAMNNFGVTLWRQRGKPEKEKKAEARVWFEKAAAEGDIAARYNLALTLPDKFDTDPDIIRKRLTLLQANVAAGDVPSMVALARSLYFVNRDAFVSDRATLRLSLLAHAAESGDPDYMVIYGKALWKEVRGGADPTLLSQALPALKAAFEKGDPRGAKTIGDILSNSPERNQNTLRMAIAAHGIEPSALLWYRRAADQGLPSAQCAYGFEVFRTRDWVRNPDLNLIERHFKAGPDVLGHTPEMLTRALADLESCASRPKRKRTPRLPFGESSLYAYKLRGTWTSMSTQPGWANMTLGVLYGYGIVVERDRDRALRYLDIAARREDFSIAAQIASTLPEF